ncbi:hypothetical protein N7454_005492 [Penicillium verhagenii]|nr:hypothetical protein N7454_005492 [Penicillium verhagenii]
MMPKAKVVLIPWDPDSGAHRKVLVKQREECSWHQERVEKEWREAQVKGEKCIYWIIFSAENSYISEHMMTYLSSKADSNLSRNLQGVMLTGNLQRNPLLRDTAQSINAIPRKPSHKAFVPVGHISLDPQNPEAKHVDLKSALTGAFWIKSFYVSRAIQSQGVGRAAMDEVEKMATRQPLNARTLMLDTIQRDDALREEFAIATTGSIPKLRCYPCLCGSG